jgi:hypothetical protein
MFNLSQRALAVLLLSLWSARVATSQKAGNVEQQLAEKELRDLHQQDRRVHFKHDVNFLVKQQTLQHRTG